MRQFGTLIQLVISVAFLVLLYTQVFSPLFRGVALFPLFRNKRRALSDDLTQAEEENELAELAAVVDEARQRRAAQRTPTPEEAPVSPAPPTTPKE